MMNVTIIFVGKLKEKYLVDCCNEYLKRLSVLCKMNMIEINEEKICDNPNDTQINIVLQKEGERIISKIPKNSYIIPMCIEGKQLDSIEFANKFRQVALCGKSNITFIIGGSFGLSDNVKKLADCKMSMSKMTFPHQLARMMLLEQIYRAFQIQNNSKYHK